MQEQTLTRYANASKDVEPMLCCPVSYNDEYLKVIPQEVIDKDYGCGDPSVYLHAGDVVLDLGSGTGKICFIASQIVGDAGKVIGVDMGDDMIEVARRNAPIVAEAIGYANTEFVKGSIEEMRVDLAKVDEYLKENPITSSQDLFAFNVYVNKLKEDPLIADKSIDVIVSNCVLNLVDQDKKENLFQEMFRVLNEGGRCVISDIVSDVDVPEYLQNDADLWTGCISGAYQEQAFIAAFEKVGFVNVEFLKYDMEPWRTVEGIKFRSVTVRAFKPVTNAGCGKKTVIYKGPFTNITDDFGNTYPRGKRVQVGLKAYKTLQSEGTKDLFVFPDENPSEETKLKCC